MHCEHILGKKSLKIRKKNASNPSYPISNTSSPQGWLVGLLGQGATNAGINISAETALRCATVFGCVRIVSEDVAKLPLIIFRTKNGKAISHDTDHALYKLLNIRPNSWQNAYEWKESMQAHLELRGNAYSFIESDANGVKTALIPIHPDRVMLLLAEDGEVFYQITPRTNEPKLPFIVPREAILHLRGMTLDGYNGISTISAIKETIALTLAAEGHAASYFGNGARPDIVITSKGLITPEQAKEIRDAWEQNYKGLKNANRPAVLPFELGIEKLALTNKDSQFLELRSFQVSDIARAFRIPPYKLADVDKPTLAGAEQQALDYFQDGLMPRLERFEAALNAALLSNDEISNYKIEFDYTRILRADIKSMMEAIASGRNWSILSTNEARSWIGLTPRKNGDDDYLIPLNMANINNNLAVASENTSKTPTIIAEENKIIDNVIFLRNSIRGKAA